MSSVLLKGVIIIDPASEHHQQSRDILIEDGIISSIAETIQSEAESVIEEAGDWYISPGWVDMQVHLNVPGFEWIEDLGQLDMAARMGGYTRLVCYPNTHPPLDNSQLIQSLRSRTVDLMTHFHFAGSLTRGEALSDLAELYDMSESGAIAFTNGVQRSVNTLSFLKGMEYVKAFNGLILHYPYEKSLHSSGLINEGVQASLLGMAGIPEIAESSSMGRDLELWSYAGCRMHFQPISSPRGLDIYRTYKKHSTTLSCATSLPYLAFDDTILKDFNTHFKLFPPLRDRLQKGKLLTALKEGVIDVINSGHLAQGREEKDVQFEQASYGMLGLQTSFSLANKYLIQEGHINLKQWVDLVSINPRNILGLPKASILEGLPVEASLFKTSDSWKLTEEHIASRAKNSPFIGETLEGKVIGNMVGSRLHINKL